MSTPSQEKHIQKTHASVDAFVRELYPSTVKRLYRRPLMYFGIFVGIEFSFANAEGHVHHYIAAKKTGRNKELETICRGILETKTPLFPGSVRIDGATDKVMHAFEVRYAHNPQRIYDFWLDAVKALPVEGSSVTYKRRGMQGVAVVEASYGDTSISTILDGNGRRCLTHTLSTLGHYRLHEATRR